MTLKGDDGVAPHLWYGAGLVGLGIEVDHDCGTGGFDLAGVTIDGVLQQREALVAQVGTLGEHLDRLVEQRGLEETAVHVGDDDRGTAPIDVGLHFQSFEIMRLAQVKELEIDRVVDVAQRIHIVETQLHGRAALEWILGFDSVVHCFLFEDDFVYDFAAQGLVDALDDVSANEHEFIGQ